MENNNLNIAVSLETQKKLLAWGSWCRAGITMKLYYRSRSLIYYLEQNKGSIIPSTNKNLMPIHAEAEEIEELITKLSKTSKDGFLQARIAYIHYANEGSKIEKAKKSGCTVGIYYKLLKCAEKWIETHLS